MNVTLERSQKPVDLLAVFRDNAAGLDYVELTSWLRTRDPNKMKSNYQRAKEFLKALRAAQEGIELAYVALQTLSAELKGFVTEFSEVDADARAFVTSIFSGNNVYLGPIPSAIESHRGRAVQEWKETRVKYKEQFIARVREYNSIVREIRHYHDMNIVRPLLGESYIEGFPSKPYLPDEIRLVG